MTPLPGNLEEWETGALAEAAAAVSLEELDLVRVKWLGRREGRLTLLLQELPKLPPEQRREVGRRGNTLKNALESRLVEKKKELDEQRMAAALQAAAVDLSLPGTPLWRGALHPLTQVQEEITNAFLRLGFFCGEGPEVETDDNNFTALNHPPDHPARDAHDTFYLSDLTDEGGKPLLLRTHTSPVQIRHLRYKTPPVYMVAPGRVFRHENVDATHSYVFHQVEGLAVDHDISMSDLKGALGLFAETVFGKGIRVRLRPSFFPFVEPGVEVDISCTLCAGKGCRVCKQTGWVEMLGAGLVHPNVFRAVNIDPEKWSGYAFGIGVERVAMFKYGVDDMRLFYENDRRFLECFA